MICSYTWIDTEQKKMTMCKKMTACHIKRKSFAFHAVGLSSDFWPSNKTLKCLLEKMPDVRFIIS